MLTVYIFSGTVSPSQIESATSPVNNSNVVGGYTNAYGCARCVPLADAANSLANIRFFAAKLVL